MVDEVLQTVDESGELPALVTPSVFAEYLGLKTQTVRDMVHRGELPAVRINRRIFIIRDEFFSRVKSGCYQV